MDWIPGSIGDTPSQDAPPAPRKRTWICVFEFLSGITPEVSVYQRTSLVDAVVPLEDHRPIIRERGVDCLRLRVRASRIKRPIELLHAEGPLVHKTAQLLEHLRGGNPLGIKESGLVLVSPCSTLEEVAEGTAEDGRQDKPNYDEPNLLGHGLVGKHAR